MNTKTALLICQTIHSVTRGLLLKVQTQKCVCLLLISSDLSLEG